MYITPYKINSVRLNSLSLPLYKIISCNSSGVRPDDDYFGYPFRVQVGKFPSDLHTKPSPTKSDVYQMLY